MIRILCVGKIRDKHLSALIEDYAKRINRYHKLEIVEVKDEAIIDDERMVLNKEAERVLGKISADEYVILVDLHGESIDSVCLSKKIDDLLMRHPKICFVIGGSLGLGDELRKRADEKMKLSDLTFLHSFTRLILLEQLYRSFKILHHETYHK